MAEPYHPGIMGSGPPWKPQSPSTSPSSPRPPASNFGLQRGRGGYHYETIGIQRSTGADPTFLCTLPFPSAAPSSRARPRPGFSTLTSAPPPAQSPAPPGPAA
jgi:hypothetical protein